MFDLKWTGWLQFLGCSLLIGITKTGIPGLGVITVPTLAQVFPARASTGVVLPLLIVADIFAVVYYRRNVVWSHLLRLVPWVAAGIAVGYFTMDRINDEQLGALIGSIILAILVIEWVRSRLMKDDKIPTQWWFAAFVGLTAGFTTMVSNAAGPIMIIYLHAMRLPRKEFIGTGAWYYLVVNCIKIPLSVSLGFINAQSLQTDLAALPLIVIGSLTGIFLLKRIPQKVFFILVRILAVAAAVRLILSSVL